jgi:hypothetical protein
MGHRQWAPKDSMQHLDASPEVTPVTAPRIASARRDRVVVRTPRPVSGELITLALPGLVLI